MEIRVTPSLPNGVSVILDTRHLGTAHQSRSTLSTIDASSREPRTRAFADPPARCVRRDRARSRPATRPCRYVRWRSSRRARLCAAVVKISLDLAPTQSFFNSKRTNVGRRMVDSYGDAVTKI